METDYATYELSKPEKRKFLILMYAFIFAICLLFYHSIILSAVCGIMSVFCVDRYAAALAEKRRTLLSHQFRDLLYSLSASIATGRQMEESIAEAYENMRLIYADDTPMVKELGYMVRAMRHNHESEEELLVSLAKRSHIEDIKNFVDVYLACRTTGGDLEKVISDSGEILMDKMDIEREIKTLTSQKQFEGKIITVMPLAVVFFLNVFSPDYLQPMYTTIVGRIVMTLSLAGIVAAYLITERLMKIEV